MIAKTCITETIEALELEGSRIAMALSTLRALIGTAQTDVVQSAPKPDESLRRRKQRPKAR